MYQHIQLRKLSKFSSNASSSKVEVLEVFKRKNGNNFFNDGGELALKELSNEMGELEEVILVEDEPALQLPQLSSECWSNFVEELTIKYERGNSPNPSNSKTCNTLGAENKSKSTSCRSEIAVLPAFRDIVGTIDERLVVSISSDEDDHCSPGKCPETNSATENFCSTALCEQVNTEAHLGFKGTKHFVELQNMDSQELHQGCITFAAKTLDIEDRNTALEINVDLKQSIVSDHNHSQDKAISDLKKGALGANKKYMDIKRKSYKLTFHRIFEIFDIEKPVPGDPIDFDFPDLDMKEFVKTVKDFQESEAADDVKHLWTQVKIWLSAMKSPYGTSNYTKYHKKLNWYITELMANYINFEIENGTQNQFNYKLQIESLTNSVSSLLNDDVKLKILTLLRTDFPQKMGNFMDDMFRKFLTHPKVRLENSDYGTYRLKILGFHKWIHYTNRRKEDIVEIAIKDGSAYLPKLVPINSEDPFYRVDYKAQLINEGDKHGTRKLLEEDLSDDMLKTSIDEYLQVYENQLDDDFVLSVFPRKGLENSKLAHKQNVTPGKDSMRMQPTSLRNDVGHCRRRKPHCSNSCGNISRTAHLSDGSDMHRIRLSSPIKSNRHSFKLLACKKHSDTRLRRTKSGNDIISLDSTDDEDENGKMFPEKSKSTTEKIYQSSQHKKTDIKRQPKKNTLPTDRSNTISRHTKGGCSRLLRNESVLLREVDTIVLDSSSDGEETLLVVDSKECDNKVDNVVVQQQAVPTAELQIAQRSQRNVSRPLRCALITSVAIKPIRKEKHCIPGEVSSTTSHDILESERENHALAISSSASLEMNNASAYENAREVGTVEILERRELRQPVVMAERCFQPGKLLLGIDYSDDENDEDDAVDRTREHATVGSDVGEDDEISNGCVLPTAGYSKVVEEATSSTEIFLRTQPVESVALSTALRAVEPAPLMVTIKKDAPTCSRYAYSTAPTPTELNNSNQKLMSKVTPQVVETKKNIINMNQESGGKAEIPPIPTNNLDTKRISVEGVTERDNCVDHQISNEIIDKEISAIENGKNCDSGVEIWAIVEENMASDNSEVHNAKIEKLNIGHSLVENNNAVAATESCGFSGNHDENAAIDQILADIDENLRKSSEINIKHLKEKNGTNTRSDFVGVCGTLEAVSTDIEVQNLLTEHNTEIEEHKIISNIETAAFNFEFTAENDRSVLNRLVETKIVVDGSNQEPLAYVDPNDKKDLASTVETRIEESNRPNDTKIDNRTELCSKEIEEPIGSEDGKPGSAAASGLVSSQKTSHISIDPQEYLVNKEYDCKALELSEEPLIEETNRYNDNKIDNIESTVASSKETFSATSLAAKEIGKPVQLNENHTIKHKKNYCIKDEKLEVKAQASLAISGRAIEIGETGVSKNCGSKDSAVSRNKHQHLMHANPIPSINKDSEIKESTVCDSSQGTVFISTQPARSISDQDNSCFEQFSNTNENLTATANTSKEEIKTFLQLNEDKGVDEECFIEYEKSLTNADPAADGVVDRIQDGNGHAGKYSKDCIKNVETRRIFRRDIPEKNSSRANTIIVDLPIVSYNPNENERKSEINKDSCIQNIGSINELEKPNQKEIIEINGDGVDGDTKSMPTDVMQIIASSNREPLTRDQPVELEESWAMTKSIPCYSNKLKDGHIEAVQESQEPKGTYSSDVEATSLNNQDISLSINIGNSNEEEISFRTNDKKSNAIDVAVSLIATANTHTGSDASKEKESSNISKNMNGNFSKGDTGVTEANIDVDSSIEFQESQLVNECEADLKNYSLFCSAMHPTSKDQVPHSNADTVEKLKQCTQISESLSSEIKETCFNEQLNTNTESLIVDIPCSSVTEERVPLVQDEKVNDVPMQTALKENKSKDSLANNMSDKEVSVTQHLELPIDTDFSEGLQKLDLPKEDECNEINESCTEVFEAPILKDPPKQNTDSISNQYICDNMESPENVFDDPRSSELIDSVSKKPEITIGIVRKSSVQEESKTGILSDICLESNLAMDSQTNEFIEQITFASDEHNGDIINVPQEVVLINKKAKSGESVSENIDDSAKSERVEELTMLGERICDANDDCQSFDKIISAERSHSKSPPTATERYQIDKEVEAKVSTNACNENDVNNDKMQENEQETGNASEPLKILTAEKDLPIDNEFEQSQAVQSSIVSKIVSDDRSAIKKIKSDEAQNATNYIMYTRKQSIDGEINASCKTDVNNSESSYITFNTLVDCFDINKDERENLETLTKRNQKSIEHRFPLEKSKVVECRLKAEAISISSFKARGKRKAVKSLHRKLYVRDVNKRTARNMRIKHRINRCSDISKESNIGNMEALKSSANKLSGVEQNQCAAAFETAEELAYNISKLVIKENREVDENSHEQEQEICSLENIKNLGDTYTKSPETTVALAISDSGKSEEMVLQKESKELILPEDCNTFQCLPSEYNSEEILAVTTLINMRNKYTSACSTSNYTDDDTVVPEVPLNTTQAGDFSEPPFTKTNQKEDNPTLKSALKKSNAKHGLVKKRVHYDEENLLQLINEQKIPSAITSKCRKKIQKFRSAEGVLLKGGNKNMKRRLLELNVNLSIDEEDRPEDTIEVIPDVKKSRGRRKIEPLAIENAEETIMPTTANEPNDAAKTLIAETLMPIYPVRLTSRRKNEPVSDVRPSKAVQNVIRRVKGDRDHPEKVDVDVGSDFIVPDEKVVSLRKPVKENIVNVTQISADGTKIKLKITQVDAVEKQKLFAADNQDDNPTSKIDKITHKENPSLHLELLKTKKAIVRIKRIKPLTYEIANSETVISTETGYKDVLPSLHESSDESIFPVSETIASLRESTSPEVEPSGITSVNVTYGANSSKIKRRKPVHKDAKSKTTNDIVCSTQHQSETVSTDSGCNDLAQSINESPVKSTILVLDPLASSRNPPLVKPSTSTKRRKPVNKAANTKTSNVTRGSTQYQPRTVISKDTGTKDLAPPLKEPPVEPTTPVSASSSNPPLVKPSTSADTGCKDLARSSKKEPPVEPTIPISDTLASSSESPSPTVGRSDSPPALVIPSTSTNRTTTLNKAANIKTSSVVRGSTQHQPEAVIRTDIGSKDLAPSLNEPSAKPTTPASNPLASPSNPVLVKPSTPTKRTKPINKAAKSKINNGAKGSTQHQHEKAISTDTGCKDVATSLKKEYPVEFTTLDSDSLASSSESPSAQVGRSDTSPLLMNPSITTDAIHGSNTSKGDSKKGRSSYLKRAKTQDISSTGNTSFKNTELSSMKLIPLENIAVVKTAENVAKQHDYNLCFEKTLVIPALGKALTIQDRNVADIEIKTEPLDDVDIKEEEVSVDALDNPPLFQNIDTTRHLKEIVLKPSEVILTEEKINEQADAHRGNRKKQKLKKQEQNEDKNPSDLSSNILKVKQIKTAITESDILSEPNIAHVSIDHENQKVEEICLDTLNSGEYNCQLAASVESRCIVEPKEPVATVSITTERTTDVETEDIATKITENVIAELKLLSPENFQNNEDDKDLNKVETISTDVSVNIEKSSQSEYYGDMNSCDVEKSDEEQKRAELLDSSIDIVLGNSSFTKSNLSPANEETGPASDANVEKMDKLENKKSNGSVSFTTPTKNRLDVLTAEKINSALEKMLEEKNSLSKDRKISTSTAANVCYAIRRQTINEDEGPRKQPSRSSLSSVKEISAKVPEALFADDESESSNADDSANEQFFAPILSLDDLLIKKDEQTDDATNTYRRQESVGETEIGHSRDGLGTPNFTVELEVETTDASDENTEKAQESVGDSIKAESHCEGTVKCVEGTELNTNLEETDASFSLSAMTDISTIDIPNDLSINSEYPDLLDAMLYEQVRQSIDCMISGTNSAKKWSQDSFATSKTPAQFNHSEVETVPRDEAKDDEPLPQERAMLTADGKTVTASDDALGIGQESFLSTINPLDEVQVPTTGFDLVGSFTIAEFLSAGGSDLFPFPELDKTQSRSNSFSADSNACNTPPPPFDAADESDSSNNKKDEGVTQLSQNTNSVACDHSYNKDINEAGKLGTKVRKKSISSNSSAFSAVQSPPKSPALKSPTMLNTFSRSKCHPKPFWKVRKTDEMKTSTPKKEEEQTFSTQNSLQIPATAKMKSTVSQPDENSTNSKGNNVKVFSMPALEIVVDAAVPHAKVTASAVHKDDRSKSATAPQPTELVTSSKSTELSNTKENTSKMSSDSANSKAEVSEEVSLRSSTPVEITEVITIPAPVIVQPIIRIQSQTNRLERIDPKSNENFPKQDEAPNASKIEINNVSRPPRDSTPTLDERVKDEFELISPNYTIVEESAGSSKHKESPRQLDEPTAKRLCIEKVGTPLSSNDIFAMFKQGEKALENDPSSNQTVTNTTESLGVVIVQASETQSLKTELNSCKEPVAIVLHKKVEKLKESAASVPVESCKEESNRQNNTLEKSQSYKTFPAKEKSAELSGEELTEVKTPDVSGACIFKSVKHNQLTLLKCNTERSPIKDTNSKADLKPIQIRENISKASKVSLTKTLEKSEETSKKQISVLLRLEPPEDISSRSNQKKDQMLVSSKTVLPKSYPPTDGSNPNENKTSALASTPKECLSARTNAVQVKNQKNTSTSPGLAKESNVISKTNLNINKIIDNNKSCLAIAIENEVKNSPQQVAVQPNSGSTARDFQANETLIKVGKKNVCPYQTSPISPRTKIPLKPTLAVAPTLLSNNTNRFHPYQRTQTMPTSSNTHKNKPTPQKQHAQAAAPETIGRKKETTTRFDKISLQRSTSTVTTLLPMQSRPTASLLPSSDMTLTITELATKKLSPADEADIAEKLRSYRAALPTAKTYGEHRENQRLVKLQEEKLRLEYAERANRRRAQQLRAEAQRLKRKSNPESFEAHYKKFSVLSGNSDGGSSRSGVHQSRTKQYQQHHTQRPRPHHEYVNKFGEIEKLVQKEKGSTDSGSKRSGPLTASTAWEPKMPTGDELIELLSKTKKA